MTTKILLVDDSPDVLTLTELMLKRVRPEWQIKALDNPKTASEILSSDREEFDAIISDYEMPELKGSELLKHAAKTQPLLVRYLVSSEYDKGSELEGLGIAHRFFLKPFDCLSLAESLERSIAVKARLRSTKLKRLLTKLSKLPSPPSTYIAIQKMLDSKGFHSKNLVELLHKQVTLSAMVLKAANSSFYGAKQPVETLERAVSLLGAKTVQAITLGAELFTQVDKSKAKMFGIDRLFEHSIRVASEASALATRDPSTKELKDLAYTAGLLHDIGKLICMQAAPSDYQTVVERVGKTSKSLYQSEVSAFGVSHQEVGAYLLTLWGLPETIIEAVAFHHQPLLSPSREISVLTFVAAANMLDHGLQDAIPVDETNQVTQYLSEVGMGTEQLMM